MADLTLSSTFEELIKKVNEEVNPDLTELETAVGNKLGVTRTNGNYLSERAYINHHPENGAGSIIPFIYNDLAHLLSKGGSCSIYTTTDTDFTVGTLTQVKTISATSYLFDASPKYQNNFSGSFTAQTSGDTTLAQETLVIDLTLHQTFTYSSVFYIDFGNTSWYCRNIQVLTNKSNVNTTYTSRANITNHSQPAYYTSFDLGATGCNKIRIVLKNPKKNLRIAQIGLLNYSSAGVTETFVSRGGSTLYGQLDTSDIYPRSNNTYNLGLTSRQYNAIYGKTLYENGTALDSKYVKPADLATVATTGSYDDLNDKPTTFFYQASSSGSTAGTWLGTVDGITSLYDGLTISYKVPVAGASTTTLNINSLGAKVCYKNNAEKITTHYPVNSILIFTYDSTLNSNAGGWRALADDGGGGSGDGGVGKSLEGQSVKPTSSSTVTAGTGAEIFNDYRDRAYNASQVTAGNVASGDYSHAEGRETTASGDCSHAEGRQTESTGDYSHAEGYATTASGWASHAEGYASNAEGDYSHAEGYFTFATEDYSHASGYYTSAQKYQYAIGRHNGIDTGPKSETDTTGSLFIIGNGTNFVTARSNAFRVSTTGTAYGLAAFQGSGADYAEMWEWADGNANNEDRRGLFVTVNADNKLEIAQPDEEYVLGVISATPVVVGDTQSEIWHEMYLKDIFGQKITETVEVEEYTDESGVVIPAHTEQRWKLNPLYNPEKEYIRREDRPEWSAVGLVGKLVTIDDGTCKAGSYCKVAENGTATASTDRRGWRVLQRLDDTHILILFR